MPVNFDPGAMASGLVNKLMSAGVAPTFNPTSKEQQKPVDPKNPFSSLGIGLKIGSFSFGLATSNDSQKGEKTDYAAFLQQAGTILKNSRFMCSVFFPSTLGLPQSYRHMTYACESVIIPPQTIETTEFRLNMLPPIMSPYFRNFGGTVTLGFRMYTTDTKIQRDSGIAFGMSTGNFSLGINASKSSQPGLVKMEPRASMLRWQEEIVNFDGDNAGVGYLDDYSKNSSIIVTQLDSGSNVLHNMEFINAYPVNVDGLTYQWDTGGSYLQQNVTFAFSRIFDSYYGTAGMANDKSKKDFLGQILGLVDNISTGNVGGIADNLGLGDVLSGNGLVSGGGLTPEG